MPLVKLISQEIVYVMLFHWLGDVKGGTSLIGGDSRVGGDKF